MILTFRITLVLYYIFKCFVIVETKEENLDKVPSNAQEQINAVGKNDN